MTIKSSESSMKRLKHSTGAWLRAHQTSATELFIYVEGKTCDRSYYERVLRDVLLSSNVPYVLELSRNIPGPSEGKPALLAGFEAAKKKRLLQNEFHGKKTALIFLLDKDVDEFTGRRKRSPSICYTKHYCVENHIIRESCIGRALALSASADPTLMCKALGSQDAWLASKAALQTEWLSLCLLISQHGIRAANYGVKETPINVPPVGPTDRTLYATHVAGVRAKSKLTADSFTAELRRVESVVKKKIKAGKHDEIFKGKWYTPFLQEEATRIVGRENMDLTRFQHSIWTSLIAELDPTNEGSARFRKVVETAVTWLKDN